MSLNVERTRELWQALREEDPHADARRSVISADASTTRAQAIAILGDELLHDPHDLMSSPPSWLVELSRLSQRGTTLLFDSRVTDLAACAVDDLVASGIDTGRLVDWLERRRSARPSAGSPSEQVRLG
jgi:hypothetical protein